VNGQGTADDEATEKIVLIRLLNLNATILGLVAAIVTGFGIFAATNWLVLKGGAVVGPHLVLLNQFFPGYDVTFVGSLIGFAYGSVCGFITGYLVASVYNGVADLREMRRLDKQGHR